MVVGRGQARCLTDRAVDIDDDTTRPAEQMVVVVTDTPLEPGRTPGRLDAADQTRRGERVQGLIHGLEGDVAYPIAHAGGDRLDPEVVTRPDGLEQCDASGRHPQASTSELLGDSRSLGCGHDPNLPA
jgi:hypothetical protein